MRYSIVSATRGISPPLGIFLAVMLSSYVMAQSPIVDQWRITEERPGEGWHHPDFDTGEWRQADGGFGTRGTPSARLGTVWNSSEIWARKQFSLDSLPEQPALWLHHDEDVEVYINGQQVFAAEGYTTEYELAPLPAQAAEALRVGDNVLALHCRQTTGGQFVDVHMVDADSVPELPPGKLDTEPFRSELITAWGSEVTAENAWTEYPRPQLTRDNWRNLNGHWEYAITNKVQEAAPEQWDGKILVPYPLESRLSGVQRLLDPREALWYRRNIEFDGNVPDRERVRLNFEAVDYDCQVFLNGAQVGSHRGGSDPFFFDVTDQLQAGNNELILRVLDATEQWQLNGKQSLNPHAIWYTRNSGIWQTVWMERVHATCIDDLTIMTDADSGTIVVSAEVSDLGDGQQLQVEVKDGEEVVAIATDHPQEVSLSVPDAKLWSPSDPHLYSLDIKLIDSQGQALDRVGSYAGIRSVGKTRDSDGNLRFTLNGEVIFHWGPLDQGWWPDGLLTPPSDEAMLFDIDYLKDAGFNMIRKHIKVEPRRYYYHCDRLGMMVWQDQVSGGARAPWTRLRPDPEDAEWPDEHHEQYILEFDRMISNLDSHPSIVVWTPFNEAWGQHRTVEVGEWVAARDPSRLVNIASGGNFWPVGDIVDHHSYPDPHFPFASETDGVEDRRYEDFIRVVGEFGGHGFPVDGHVWDANRRNWGYGELPKTLDEYRQRYVGTLDGLNRLRGRGIAAGVYTQTTDVEGEVNGLMTYDRKVAKISAEELAELHRRLFEPLP